MLAALIGMQLPWRLECRACSVCSNGCDGLRRCIEAGGLHVVGLLLHYGRHKLVRVEHYPVNLFILVLLSSVEY